MQILCAFLIFVTSGSILEHHWKGKIDHCRPERKTLLNQHPVLPDSCSCRTLKSDSLFLAKAR